NNKQSTPFSTPSVSLTSFADNPLYILNTVGARTTARRRFTAANGPNCDTGICNTIRIALYSIPPSQVVREALRRSSIDVPEMVPDRVTVQTRPITKLHLFNLDDMVSNKDSHLLFLEEGVLESPLYILNTVGARTTARRRFTAANGPNCDTSICNTIKIALYSIPPSQVVREALRRSSIDVLEMVPDRVTVQTRPITKLHLFNLDDRVSNKDSHLLFLEEGCKASLPRQPLRVMHHIVRATRTSEGHTRNSWSVTHMGNSLVNLLRAICVTAGVLRVWAVLWLFPEAVRVFDYVEEKGFVIEERSCFVLLLALKRLDSRA
ncbi:hypothetical protein RYX36_022990, partial [Vicia faba]